MATQKKRTKLPSMKDVAKRAGVSQTTVSFVVNNVEGANIPAETQERIFAAIEELGYRPNAMARQLRSNRTHTIGFVSDVVATTPFAGQIIQGAQDAAWEQNYLLLVVNTGGNQAVKHAAVDMLLERRVDGILYATMYHRAVAPPVQVREVPTVLLDCFVEDRSLPSVVPDEVKGGYEATAALLRKGHTRIGFINNFETVPAMLGRQQGYQQALAAFGVTFDANLVSRQTSEPFGGYAGVAQLLALPDPPTAIFCFNDRMALGVYRYAQQYGLHIPDDLAIVGFDNQDMIAPYLEPPLTTMELPHYAMGQWAVRHLLQLIEQDDHQNGNPPVQHLCECPLIVRSSL
jgi:LacI family transcriptional regulator